MVELLIQHFERHSKVLFSYKIVADLQVVFGHVDLEPRHGVLQPANIYFLLVNGFL